MPSQACALEQTLLLYVMASGNPNQTPVRYNPQSTPVSVYRLTVDVRVVDRIPGRVLRPGMKSMSQERDGIPQQSSLILDIKSRIVRCMSIHIL